MEHVEGLPVDEAFGAAQDRDGGRREGDDEEEEAHTRRERA